MDYSMIAPKAAKKVQGAAPPPPAPPPPEEFAHPRAVGPHLNGYMPQLEQLSRIRHLKNIEVTHSRNLRMNFRNYMHDFDEHYYGHGPPMHNEVHHHPPPGYPGPDSGPGREPAPRTIPRGLPPLNYVPPAPAPAPAPLPRPRYMPPGPPPPPPPRPPHYGPPPYMPEPPPAGYPPCNYFSDENPNGCRVM